MLIQIRKIHKNFGPQVIFDDVSATFAAGDRVGVIGRNGSGKTTLCKLILEEDEADAGEVIRSPRLRLSYLEQRDAYEPGETVLAFLMRYTGKEDWRCGKIAGRFQLKNEILEAQISDLPGGFQTRVKLAAMLLRDPNFIILDEPTNYLDLKTLILLERFLADFVGGYLIVSHDREFLKRTCDQTLEAALGGLVRFAGDVEAFLQYKAERRDQDERYNKNVEAKKKHLKEFVARYRVRAATASRAQSKLKQMEKLKTIGIEHAAATARIRLPAVEAKKGLALRCSGLEIGYPDKVVARDIHFEIERGQHVAVLGDNGQGKTTFLRTIASALSPLDGEFSWGHGLRPGYYAQHVYASLPSELDVHTYLQQTAAKDVLPQEILDMAGSFLFRGDEVRKPISVLSGGERARVCLAGLLLSKKSVLLLDEPTNHLDFETVEALGNALRDFQGTLFFITHDRTFVQLVGTSIIDVRDGAVTLYPADYEAYVYRTEREVDEDLATKPDSSKKTRRGEGGSQGKPSEHQLRKARRARLLGLKKEVRKFEARLDRLQKERDELNAYFLANPVNYSVEKNRRLNELASLIDKTESSWLECQDAVEALEGESEP
jgi:ATP-binding cassette subfamily F protein 3